jgi:metal-dependent amidase/aminoacylase/carboxypeptidase family protein
LTFGKMQAEGATNVIPEEVYLEGTFRTFDEAWRDKTHQHIKRTAQGLVEGLGGRLEIEINKGYPVLYNDEELTGRVREAMIAFMGADNVVDLDLWTAAEDFAYYTHEIPGCFYRLGTRNTQKGITHGLHTPRFNVEESALQHSTSLMAWLAVQELAHQAAAEPAAAQPA